MDDILTLALQVNEGRQVRLVSPDPLDHRVSVEASARKDHRAREAKPDHLDSQVRDNL